MKTCANGGKVCMGEKQAKLSISGRNKSMHGMYPYICPFCFYWHLSKKGKKNRFPEI